MKKNNYLLLLAMACALTVPAQKIKNFEIEAGGSCNIPEKRNMSSVITNSNLSTSFKTKNIITFGYYATVSYAKKLGLGFSVVPGISFISFNKENNSVREQYNTITKETSTEKRDIKSKYDNLALNLGLRWSFSKISLEAGLAYMAAIKQERTTTVSSFTNGASGPSETETNNPKGFTGFGYYYGQLGFKLIPHVWLNAGLRVIMNGKDLMHNDYTTYYDKSQLAKRELVPTLGIKIRL